MRNGHKIKIHCISTNRRSGIPNPKHAIAPISRPAKSGSVTGIPSVPAFDAASGSNAAGDARFLAASGQLTDVTAEPIAQLARETMRAASARTVNELTEAQRPVPAMRSAMLVPVSVAALDVRGVLVVLHHEPSHFREADIELARPFAQYLWVVLRSAPLPVGGVVAGTREKTN